MKFSNLFDKFKIVFNLVTNSNVFIILVFIIIGLLILKLFNKINNRKLVFAISVVEAIVFGVVFYIEKNTMLEISNNIIDNIFLNFYFPSIYVYLFILVFSIVVFIYNFLNKHISKTYKTITNIYFLMFNFIFILLVKVISTNNIDVFLKESLFTNKESLVLLELSTLLFFIYLVVNAIIYITNSLIIAVGNKKEKPIKNKELQNSSVSIEINLEEKELINPEPLVSFNELVKKMETENKTTNINLVPEVIKINKISNKITNEINLIPEINNNFKFIDPILFDETEQKESSLIEKLNKEIDILNNSFVIQKEEKITLNDYKLFSRMLKTVIQNNRKTNLTITDILNKNILNEYTNDEYKKFEKILNSCMN